MSADRPPSRKGIINALTSVRLTAALLVLLAIVCVIATLIPQNLEPAYYTAAYGSGLAAVILAAGLEHAFSCALFIILAALLAINLVACTLLRLTWAWRRKNSPSAWGSPLLHIGLVLVLAGVVVSAIFGQVGYYNIVAGETVRVAEADPPFALTLESFHIDYYENTATPRQYASVLTAAAPGGPATELYSEVNAPAKYGGVKVYQMVYGQENHLLVNDEPITLNADTVLQLAPEVYLRVAAVPDEARPLDAPRLFCTVSVNGQRVAGHTLAVGESAELMPGLTVGFTGSHYYSGLQIKRDAGVPVIFAGFILCLLGMGMRFLLKGRTKSRKTAPAGSNAALGSPRDLSTEGERADG